MREVEAEGLSQNIRPLGQLQDTYIIATDEEGLLLIDQHIAHERILYEKYRTTEPRRVAESQHLLLPEMFDLTPAQAASFDAVYEELESYGFELMRLSGRTVAVKAVPADLPAAEARNLLAEVLDSVEAEKRGSARAVLQDKIASSLACHAAIKANTPLSTEKMRWLINKLLTTPLASTGLHGRPIILRLRHTRPRTRISAAIKALVRRLTSLTFTAADKRDMNTKRCDNCRFLNFSSAAACKRCGADFDSVVESVERDVDPPETPGFSRIMRTIARVLGVTLLLLFLWHVSITFTSESASFAQMQNIQACGCDYQRKRLYARWIYARQFGSLSRERQLVEQLGGA
ncbi:MAG: hypothetical protein WKF84_22615 [Pyrinomonadaceae bacterium]